MEEANKDDTSDDWGETVEELTRPVAALASSARVAATDGRPIPRGRSLVPSDAATTSRPSIGPRRTSGRYVQLGGVVCFVPFLSRDLLATILF